MTEETTRAKLVETEERTSPCCVRHPNAGGQCPELGTRRVHGLLFCERHGLEAEAGAGVEVYDDTNWFFERFRAPHVPSQSDGIERVLEHTLAQLRKEYPSDSDHHRALMAAYPEIPEETRKRVEAWKAEDAPGYFGALDTLLDELHTFHKLLRIAYVEGMTWVVEILEQERQSNAAQAAYLLSGQEEEEEASKANAG